MDEMTPTPEQLARMEQASIALQRHAARVGVDLRAAMAKLGTVARHEQVSDSVVFEEIEVDVSAMLRALEQLPDGAGMEPFLSALAQARARDAALMRSVGRVGVDMRSALETLYEGGRWQGRISEEDLFAATERALETLPDGAGTAAFVAAFRAQMGVA